MVKYNDGRLDQIFSALSDRTRRGILAHLSARNSVTVSELAEPFAMSLPAVMKHLNVLSDAGLVKRTKKGRSVACVLDAKAMRQANDWLERYQRFWTAGFDRLAQALEDDTWSPQPPQNQASPSSAASRRRRPRSSRPGPTRKS